MTARAAASQMARNTGQGLETGLTRGSLYDGVVRGYDRDADRYTVSVRGVECSCLYAAGICGRLVGIKQRYRIPDGTQVYIVYGGLPVIIGFLPSNEAGPDRHSTPFEERTQVDDERATGDDPSIYEKGTNQDMLSGELDLSNTLHTGIQLMTTFARLQGGDRAMVETHVLNDMVRIVSEVYRHHSAFGDQEIFGEGRVLNSVEHGTSYDHEAWGAEDKDSDLKKIDFDHESGFPNPESVAETGRWRYSRFLGYLGDFVHIMVSDPASGIGQLAASALRAGKARVQIQSDGTLLAQSVADIVLERVCRVQVPVQLKEHDAVDVEALVADSENQYTSIWSGLKESASMQDLASMSYQLREYARWLGSYQSLARFASDTHKWKVPSERDSLVPEWTNKERDRETGNANAMTHLDVYACIRIMRDGSIVVMSGDGSSVVMAGGSLQVHATRLLELLSAGDIRVRAGRDLHLEARRHINIMATVGGLKLKARTCWEALCEWGTLWLKSDAMDPEIAENLPAPAEGDPDPVIREHAVMIESTGGRSLIHSEGSLTVLTNRELDPEHPRASGIRVEARGGSGVGIRSERGRLDLWGRDLHLRATDRIMHQCRDWMAAISRVFTIRDWLTVRSGTLAVNAIKAQRVDARTNLSGPESTEAAKRVGLRGQTQTTDQDDQEASKYHAYPSESAPNPAVWTDEVIVTPNPGPWPAFATTPRPAWAYTPEPDQMVEVQRQTLTDQFLNRPGRPSTWPADWDAQLEQWTPASTNLRQAPGTERSNPYPPVAHHNLAHFGGDPLNEPSTKELKDLTSAATDYRSVPTLWHYFKPE